MQIYSATQTQPPTTDATKSGEAGMSDMFMQLLVAQLKSQTPMDPLNPNEFLGQLAQFNTLNEIIKIRQLLETPPTPTSAPTNSIPGGQ